MERPVRESLVCISILLLLILIPKKKANYFSHHISSHYVYFPLCILQLSFQKCVRIVFHNATKLILALIFLFSFTLLITHYLHLFPTKTLLVLSSNVQYSLGCVCVVLCRRFSFRISCCTRDIQVELNLISYMFDKVYFAFTSGAHTSTLKHLVPSILSQA